MIEVSLLYGWLPLVGWINTMIVVAVLVGMHVYRRMFNGMTSKVHASSNVLSEKTQDLAQAGSQIADGEPLDFSSTGPIAANFDWQDISPVPYRPWHDGPHHVTMGIQKTTLDDWVQIDKEYLSRYQYKTHLFSKHPNDTICYLPNTSEACFEALEYLVDFLPRRYPTMFEKIDNGIKNLVTHDIWDLRRDATTWKSYHPLQVMGLLSTEDWFILQTDKDQQTTRLTAGANCFPAGWRLRQRVGKSLWQIHAGKVPKYEEKLSKSMDRFFLRLQADKPFMRYNYAIDISSELFHIESHHNLRPEELETPVTIDQLHLRVERQFLQRLPVTQAILFSIRTYITPITEVCKDKAVARALQTQVRSYGPEVSKYKNKSLWDDVLTKHLEEVLGDSEKSA